MLRLLVKIESQFCTFEKASISCNFDAENESYRYDEENNRSAHQIIQLTITWGHV
jgi:hypothetical protein